MSEVNVLKDLLKGIASLRGIKPEVKVSVVIDFPEGRFNEGVLNELVSKGYVKAKLVDRIVICPKCGSASVLTKYVCPKCLSIDVVKSRLIQHLACGYTGSELSFLRDGNTIICPKCGKKITEESNELKTFTTFFECNACHHKTSSPSIIHVCYDCGAVFRPIDAVYKAIYMYELSEEGVKLISK